MCLDIYNFYLSQDKKHRGKGTTDGYPHFQCGHKNAVYVSMDKIIKKTTVSSCDGKEERREPDNVIKENPRLVDNTRSKDSHENGEGLNHHGNSEQGEALKKERVGFVQMAMAFFTGTNQGEDQPVSLPSHPVYQNIPHSGSPSLQRNPDSSHSSPHSQHHHGNSDQGQVSQHQVSNLDQISSGLAVGSMVQMTSRGGAPIRGVIQWIGIVPHFQGYVAGVELVSTCNNL